LRRFNIKIGKTKIKGGNMARPEDADIVKAMKNAKTPQEIVLSWATQANGKSVEKEMRIFDLWVQRKPEMLETFAKNVLTPVIDRGILDAKTRTIVNLAINLTAGSKEGVFSQVANAKGAGWTEEEMMEVAYLVCYLSAKGKMAMASEALSEAFKGTADVKPRNKKS
jgi:alkylhydroperoxidase/carboxymuconolactone decarboxylase family protein YurZ